METYKIPEGFEDQNRESLKIFAKRKQELQASLEREGITDEERKKLLAEINDLNEWISTTEEHLKEASDESDDSPQEKLRTLH